MKDRAAILVKKEKTGYTMRGHIYEYTFQCIDCGKQYTRSYYSARTTPYCVECSRIHEKQESTERYERYKKQKEQEISNRAIEDFLKRVVVKVSELDNPDSETIQQIKDILQDTAKEMNPSLL